MMRPFIFALSASISAIALSQLLQGKHASGICLLTIALLMFLLALLLPRLMRIWSPFNGPIGMAGLASAHSSPVRHDSRDTGNLLRFELDVLRLVNEVRSARGVSEVGLHGPLLAESRESSARVARSWRFFPDCLRTRMLRRGHFCSGLEIASVLDVHSARSVVDRWMRRRRSRAALLGPGYDVGAVGLTVESKTQRGCVTVLLGRLQELH